MRKYIREIFISFLLVGLFVNLAADYYKSKCYQALVEQADERAARWESLAHRFSANADKAIATTEEANNNTIKANENTRQAIESAKYWRDKYERLYRELPQEK